MVDLRRVGGAVGRGLVRGLQTLLALALLFSLWALSDVPTGPDAPEQAGTFTWAFLFSWGLAGIGLGFSLLGEFLVAGYRRLTTTGNGSYTRRIGRLVLETLLGAGVVVAAPPLDTNGPIGVLLVSAVVAWAILIHHSVTAVRFARTLVPAP